MLKDVQEMIASIDPTESESLPVRMVGSDNSINVQDWLVRLADILEETDQFNQSAIDYRSVRPSSFNRPLVSIITSLYRGRSFLEFFLENITTQTIFKDDCELVIINVSPSEGETELIEQYQKKFDNIQLVNIEERIGIYQAWNLAIDRSSGEFITNANVDDLRHQDSLEIQAKALLEQPDVSVVYSDVFYTFFPNLPFEFSAKCGLKTNLPAVNKFNLLRCNSPHNAPMWRRSLHEKIGSFDASFQSVGDHDFWIRACLEGVKFRKIEDTLISYFFNPKACLLEKAVQQKWKAISLLIFIRASTANSFSHEKQRTLFFFRLNCLLLHSMRLKLTFKLQIHIFFMARTSSCLWVYTVQRFVF
ncbi:MAG: glycosyltransferase [Leptolyngbyaceae cyanobacterium SM1_3_5]|nr:glycosyltransferase [Leptolyngbyaceae cyanobacterium SM1_3_5]